MVGDLDMGYLAGLPADQRESLERVNGPGLAALRSYLASGEAVAFLGAGASVPLYPLWAQLIHDLVNAAAGRLDEAAAASCRALAASALIPWRLSNGSSKTKNVSRDGAGDSNVRIPAANPITGSSLRCCHRRGETTQADNLRCGIQDSRFLCQRE